jgi:hypothetical protein
VVLIILSDGAARAALEGLVARRDVSLIGSWRLYKRSMPPQ